MTTDSVHIFDVFISYAHEKRSPVSEIAAHLRQEGLRVWFDEDAIRAGDHVDTEIKEAIKTSRCAVLFLSQSYLASRYCQAELDTINARNKIQLTLRVIPVLLEPVSKPLFQEGIKHIDMIYEWEKKFEELLAGIRKTASEPRQEPRFSPLLPDSAPAMPLAYLSKLKRRIEVKPLAGLPSLTYRRLDMVFVEPPARAQDPSHFAANKNDISREDTPVFPLAELRERSLYVDGLAGSGKTTLCRKAVLLATNSILDASNTSQQFFHRDMISVYIDCGDLWRICCDRNYESIVVPPDDAIKASFNELSGDSLSMKLLDAHIASGTVLFIFDGLDAFPRVVPSDPQRRPRSELIETLSMRIAEWTERGNRVLVTGRATSVVPQEYLRLEIAVLHLSDFKDADQDALVSKAMAVLGNTDVDNIGRLSTLLRANRLLTAETTPMFATAVCALYHEKSFKEVPKENDICEQYIDQLIMQHFEDIERVRPQLASIAFAMWSAQGIGADPVSAISFECIETTLREMCEVAEPFIQRDALLTHSGVLCQVNGPQRTAEFTHKDYGTSLCAEHLATKVRVEEFPRFACDYSNSSDWRSVLKEAMRKSMRKPERQRKCLHAIRVMLTDANSSEFGRLAIVADWISVMLAYMRDLITPNEPIVLLESECENLSRLFAERCKSVNMEEIPFLVRIDIWDTLGEVHELLNVGKDIEFVEIPEGTYRFQENRLKHEGFLISRFPITNSQFALFIQEGEYLNPNHWSPQGLDWLRKEEKERAIRLRLPTQWAPSNRRSNQPVVEVSFFEAEAYANWKGGKLPSEAEWEAVARGSTDRQYPWGDVSPEDFIPREVDVCQHPLPVGILSANSGRGSGVEDMAGNVWQWCRDEGTWRPNGMPSRSVRGGHFRHRNTEDFFRCTYRGAAEEAKRFVGVGFRIVKYQSK